MADPRSQLIYAVDVGNSSAKFGAFVNRNTVPESFGTFSTSDSEPVTTEAEFADDQHHAPWYIASVCRPAKSKIVNWVSQKFPAAPIVEIGHNDCPIKVDVETPSSVGIDRILGAVAANELRTPSKSAIIVDAGSAITVDAVARCGTFVGGAIMAGFAMRTRALASKTDLLPLVHSTGSDEAPEVIGRSTEQAIRSGIYWGTIGSIREMVSRIQESIGDADIFVTGGDMVRMTEHIHGTAKFVPHLVVSGIAITANRISDTL